MNFTKSTIAILSLSIITSTVHAQLVPGLRPGTPPGQGGGLTPGPRPGEQTPPPVVQPAKRQIDPMRLEETVKRAAEIYTREVLEIVGELYNVRYNMRDGIRSAQMRLGDYNIISNVQRSFEYQNALRSGEAEGNSSGLNDGRSDADRAAYAMADADIGTDVDRAIDLKQPIKFNPNPRTAPYSGRQANISYPETVDSRFINNRLQKHAEIDRIIYNSVSTELFRYVFDLSSLLREDLLFIPDAFRGDQALHNFLNNSLNTRSSELASARQYWREISDGNVYENPMENRRLFETNFLRYYNRGIEFNWNQRVRQMNSSARNLGETLYTQDAESFARELGRYDGFRRSYPASTVNGFNSEIISAYTRNYETIKTKVQTGSHITEVKAQVISEADGKTEFTIGDTFDVVLEQITNRGMVGTDVRIDIITSGNVKSMEYPRNVRVDGLTRLRPNERMIRLGWLSGMQKPDDTFTVTAVIGSQQVSASFKQTFEAALRKIAKNEDPNMSTYLLGLINPMIKAQYDDISGFKDQYKKRRPDMLLVRMAALFPSLSEQEKENLRNHGQLIRDLFGPKPSKFLNPKRDEWDAVQALISEMGLKGSVPKD